MVVENVCVDAFLVICEIFHISSGHGPSGPMVNMPKHTPAHKLISFKNHGSRSTMDPK